MISDTLQMQLDSYEIGSKIRSLRKSKSMGLVELGEHTGLSPALLSKIETGKMIPTLPTLLRIALVFSVDLEWFFRDPTEQPTFAVVRSRDRLRFPDNPKSPEPAYEFESLDFNANERLLNAYEATILRGGDDDPVTHEHAGVEFVFVLEGTLELSSSVATELLEPGDAAYFDSSIAHGYRRVGAEACRILTVTADR